LASPAPDASNAALFGAPAGNGIVEFSGEAELAQRRDEVAARFEAFEDEPQES